MDYNFLDIAFKCGMSSFQQDAVKALLCIENDVKLDKETVNMFANDFPYSFRQWILVNNYNTISFEKSHYKNICK
jgi:hypothetical protein